MKRILTYVSLGLLAVIMGIQLIPVDRSNPPVTQEIQWDSPETRVLAERACFDCHSNETKWPWYTRIAPVSWWIAESHVSHGRGHLNFSEWDGSNEHADEIIEVVKNRQMPLSSYVIVHTEADLSDAEVQALVEGLEKTLAADPPQE